MDGQRSRRRKLAWWAVAVLTLLGIILLAESGIVGILVLLVAFGLATALVVRT